MALLIVMLLGLQEVNAQEETRPLLKNLRSRQITLSNDTIRLDSLSILDISFVPTLMPSGDRLDTSRFHLDWINAELIIRDSSLIGQNLKCVYRVFPFRMESVAFHKSTDHIVEYNADSFYFNPYYYRPSVNKDEQAIEWGQLNYSGSFARGVSFGSSQSLAINSELDLQLTGYIGKDVEITAALTDNNIPIQPDGNTAQIQDFDKVYIQVKKGKHEVVAGDFEIEEKESYFMRYYKQLQGASYKGEFDIMKDLSLKSSMSFAIAKGQFTRNTFNGKEGNQGPYRLTGANGETFIIILAGSEKVFIDNVLLKRGLEYDYIIDYNAGEISFTPNYLITKDSRIVIEFEYSDRNYFRTFIETGHTLKYKSLEAYFKFYNEQDNKNNPINVSLDDEERMLLSSIGDNIQAAFIDGAKEVEYDPSRVLYKLIDTTVNAILYDTVYVFSTNEDSARYSLSFTYVGPGMGHYDPDINSANGRVFKWLAPDLSGNPTGSYEPVILLVTPKKKMVMALGAQYALKEKWTFSGEVALSNYDLNRFSDIGDGDDKDIGGESRIRFEDKIGSKQEWKVASNIGYEYKGKDFESIEPYRPVEFRRDWNLGVADSSVNEHFVFGDVRFFRKEYNVSYRFSTFNRSSIYKGYKNAISFDMNNKGWRVKAFASLLNSSSAQFNSFFFRPNINVEKDFKLWKGLTVGIGGQQEYNKVVDPQTDSLLQNSFLNNTMRGYLRSSDSSKVGWKVMYTRRTDSEDKSNTFKKAAVANTVEWLGDVRALKNQSLKWQFTYRNLQVKDSVLTQEESDNNILGRLEYGFRIFRGAIRYNSVYELGSGQERQRDFTYLKVQTGEGVYSWIDQNTDGFQQQNEFVVSEFSDSASYIRVFSNYNDFVQAHVSRFDQSVTINPKIAWSGDKGIKGFLARFSIQSSILINKKSLRSAGSKAFNPFLLSSKTNDIIVVNASIRNALYFNRTSSVYKFSYIQSWNQNKALLLNGIDARQASSHKLETKWNVKKFLALRLDGGITDKIRSSEFFDSDDFDITKYEVETGAEYTWKTKIRTALRYNYGLRTNAPQFGGERADVHETGWDFKLSLVGKSTLIADFRFVQISYNGEKSSTKTYEILEGLKQGKNYLWNLRFDQKLARNIQLTLQYEGRKSGDSKVVNTGRAQIRALF